jgi:hypothetical protein
MAFKRKLKEQAMDQTLRVLVLDPADSAVLRIAGKLKKCRVR